MVLQISHKNTNSISRFFCFSKIKDESMFFFLFNVFVYNKMIFI